MRAEKIQLLKDIAASNMDAIKPYRPRVAEMKAFIEILKAKCKDISLTEDQKTFLIEWGENTRFGITTDHFTKEELLIIDFYDEDLF